MSLSDNGLRIETLDTFDKLGAGSSMQPFLINDLDMMDGHVMRLLKRYRC